MRIDAIVSDLDDTLLSPEAALTPYTLSVLADARARGVRVIPASGRAVFSMRPFVEQLGPVTPYIACNGAVLARPDHTALETRAFPPDRARVLCRWLRERAGYVQVYHGETFLFSKDCEASRAYERSSGMRGVAVGDLEGSLTFDTPKILSVAEPEVVARLLIEAREAFPEAEFSVSKPYFLEAQPKGVTKGAALKRLAELCGLSPERTLVFGDSLNDLSMLAYAAHSVAVGNAREEVKRAARYVCLSNAEDGVARFVAEHVLNDSEERAR